ncbi:serine hydrolase domain-containing protein [Flavisphingomonas formosensis]|uniref:serine hydrolase domain-containing protein n=1 Tax=Flavisphingomonas formosensis TaxID=861534 RepID=UPI0012F85810|nr:serine hydrolase [Sphingomonas formosensis]
MTLPPPIDWPEAGIGPGPDIPSDRRVTRANWRMWPYSRWAFQHARELVPSRALPRAPAARTLPERPLDLSGLRFGDGEGGETDWAEFLRRSYTDALIVLHRGAIVHEYYANGMTAASPHMLFSITKSIIGLVAERLIATGRIDPDAPVGTVVPELAGGAFGPARLRHLLDMTDGAAFDENYADADAEVHRYSAAYWTPEAGLDGVLGQLPSIVRRAAEPGALFAYRTPVADVLGLALRRATGRPLAELVAEEIWTPAGCGDEAYMLLDTAGMEIAATGLNATVRDMARLALWLIETGEPLAGLIAGGDRALFAAAGQATRPNGSYRSFWWIDHGRPPAITANGVFGQRLWIDPAAGLAVARVGTHPVASNGFTDMLHREAFAAVRAALD